MNMIPNNLILVMRNGVEHLIIIENDIVVASSILFLMHKTRNTVWRFGRTVGARIKMPTV
jgi:hypothetical protein